MSTENHENTNWMYMLRTTQQHHVQLSSFADQKANIIIASNCIIFSITLARIETAVQYWGVWALLATSVLCIITAVMVVAPLTLPKKRPPFDSKNFNPLFFMHFTAYSPEEYYSRMKQIMGTKEGVQESMIRDIYQIGKVLSTRKYPFLKISSAIFIGGLILSLMLFSIQIGLDKF
jgi:hypothetical protein